MLSRTPLRRFSDERAQSLVLALLVLTFLAVSLGTVMFFTAGNQRNSNYQKTVQLASSLAEAGVNNAVSVLANPSNSCCLEIDPTVDPAHAVLPTAGPTEPWAQSPRRTKTPPRTRPLIPGSTTSVLPAAVVSEPR